MKLFTDEHAGMYKEAAGKPYRPANAIEGDMFFIAECEDCIHASSREEICLTEELSFLTSKKDHLYPVELQYGPDGQPCCRRKTVLPPKK